MVSTAIKVRTVLSLMKTFISINEEQFRKFVTDTTGSVHNCYVGRALNDGHIALLPVPTDLYESSEEKD